MVDSIDFNTFDLSQEFAEQLEFEQQSQSQTDYHNTQESIDFDQDNYEFNLSQSSPSIASSHSHSISYSQSDGERCNNCQSINTLKEDNKSGHKMCINCGHIIQV